MINNIAISQESTSYYILDHKNNFNLSTHPLMVCQVKWKDGYKIVTFGSSYIIKNSTPYTTEMQVVQFGQGETPTILHTSTIGEFHFSIQFFYFLIFS